MMSVASGMGIKSLVLECDDKLFGDLKSSSEAKRLTIYRRRTIEAEQRRELYDQLSSTRWYYEFISVRTDDREVAMAALRDNRVDSLVISAPGGLIIDKHLVAVTTNAVEVVFRDLLSGGYEVFERLMRSFKILRQSNVRVIISSGSSVWIEMRNPRQLVGALLTLGLPPERCFAAVSDVPLKILRENRGRITGTVDVSGVWEVER